MITINHIDIESTTEIFFTALGRNKIWGKRSRQSSKARIMWRCISERNALILACCVCSNCELPNAGQNVSSCVDCGDDSPVNVVVKFRLFIIFLTRLATKFDIYNQRRVLCILWLSWRIIKQRAILKKAVAADNSEKFEACVLKWNETLGRHFDAWSRRRA